MVPKDEYVPVQLPRRKSIDWLDSMALSSKDIEKLGLDMPPCMQFHDYLLDHQYLKKRARPLAPADEVREMVYRIEARFKVPVGQEVILAERARAKLMGIHAKIIGDPSKVSYKFSGKDREAVPLKGHVHCYISPLDRDGDGFLDHLSVRCAEPFTKEELIALDRLEGLRWQHGQELLLTPIGYYGGREKMSQVLVSKTPYVSPRHHRKGRGEFMEWLTAELERDLRDAGLPKPRSIEVVPSLRTSRGDVQWFEFVRSRKNEKPRFGYGFRLEFDSPVPNMVNVGYGAHFGLGLFLPDEP